MTLDFNIHFSMKMKNSRGESIPTNPPWLTTKFKDSYIKKIER